MVVLTPREAAKGAMWDLDMIQNILDPLGHIIDVASVKKEDLIMVVRFLLHCNINIQL